MAEAAEVNKEPIENTEPVEPSTENTTTDEVVSHEDLSSDRARQMGWRPLEEFDGDKSRWVDAREFILRGELYDRMHQRDRQFRELQTTMQNLISHNKKVEHLAYERAVKDLTAAKKSALEQGDAAAVVEIDERLGDVRDQMKSAANQTAQQAAQNTPPEYFDFASANPWYTKDRAMTAFADQVGMEYFQQGHSPAEVYKKVESEVKKEFAHKFARPKATESVASGNSASHAGGKSSGKFSPSAEEQTLAKQFVKHGVFKNEEEYYKQLRKGSTKGGN